MKVVLQDGIKDCGICCLLSIIRYYGGNVSKEYLREITNTSKEGVSLYNLIEGAQKIGFEAIGMTGNLEDIKVNNLPCIVHLIVNKSYKHFVVLYQIIEKKQQVIIMDPAVGKKSISFSEFRLLSSSNYLFLKPIKKIPIMEKKHKIINSVKVLYAKNKNLLIQIFILTTSYFIWNIICSFHFKFLMEYAIHTNLTMNVYTISFLIAILYGIKNLNSFFRNVLWNKWNCLFDYETTSITYKQLLLLPYYYYKNRTTGEVVSRFKDLNTTRGYISNFFCIATTDFISIIIFFWILRTYSVYLTRIILIPIFFIGLYTMSLRKKKKKYLRMIHSNQDTIHSYLIQGISNVDTIKGFHLEKRLIDKFSLQYKVFLEKIYQYNMLLEISQFLKNNIRDIIYILLYGLGSYYIIQGKISISNLILYQTFFVYFQNSIQSILYFIEEYPSFKVSLERIEEIFMIKQDQFDNHYFYLPYQLKGDIVFQNINYNVGAKTLLKELNLTIHQGEKVLLSGESGSGKSTLLKMLLRYIEVDFGHIQIAGIDINHYHLENIRSHITYVNSNEYLFTDTIKNNIVMYKEEKEEDFQEVCKICMVEDIVKNNSSGYNALIEENGFNLSNGERQRIVLARSILRKSSIYILDEALAGIDITREKKILTEIFQYLKEETIIVISHRFNNKKCFDRVLKLEGGKIIENKKLRT